MVLASSGQPMQRVWAGCAVGGYALAALAAALGRSRGRAVALVTALVGAVVAPLAWHVTLGGKTSRVAESSLHVVARSAAVLLRRGTPYLPAGQISHVLGYNPYEPAMALFGLPAAVGLRGVAGNPGLWMGVTAVLVLAAAFRLATPGGALRATAFAVGSPALALPLTTGLTDLPVLALLILTLACTAPSRPRRSGQLTGAIALGAACAIKAIAWPAVPVIAAMLAGQDGARAAIKFAVRTGITAMALMAVTAPAAVRAPAALVENTVLFPLGMTRYRTAADSPLPGHLLADTGPAGRWVAIGLLAAASLAIGASLIVRPPVDTRAAAWRLAATLVILFALGPASRWGYFVYPAALVGFVTLTRNELGPWRAGPAPPGLPARHLIGTGALTATMSSPTTYATKVNHSVAGDGRA